MAITSAVGDLFASIYELFASLFNTIYTIIHSVLSAILGFIQGFFNLITDVLSGLVDVTGGVGKFVASKFLHLSLSSFSSLYQITNTG
jgi:phage-related protein